MNIGFDDLKEGQKKAFDLAVELVKSKRKHMTLNGPAGTGKTTWTKFFIEYLVKSGESGIILAAPTHQAKKVLSKLSGVEAATIHSILKINPTTYEENVLFEQKEIPDLAQCRVLICDEASMYDRKLFDILMNTIPSWCTVIALGDKDQIRPVELNSQGNGQISAFFYDPRFEQAYLTEIVRSNAPIIEVATAIREGGWLYENLDESGEGVHAYTKSGTALKDFFRSYFTVVKSADDLFENRMCAYTNKSVDTLNGIIRRRIYETDKPFVVGEVLVMQEPLTKELQFEGKRFSEMIFHNGQMVRIVSAELTSTFLKAKGVSGEQMVRYWSLVVETNDNEDEYFRERICVLADEQEMNKYHFFLAKTADAYKSGAVKAHWADFWKAKRTFIKVKALPCSTIHKTQGISVNSCFLYTPCIHKADTDLAKQLVYVGATRPRFNLHYV